MWGLPPLVYGGGVGGSYVGAVGAVEAQFAVGVAFGAVLVVEHAVVAAALAAAVVDVGGPVVFPGLDVVDVVVEELAAHEAAVAAVAYADGPALGGVPFSGFATQV